MNNPSFSCICITAGRKRQLEEAIACFLAQKCDWERELVILNTLPAQTLALDGAEEKSVRIFNPETRPPSLGAARNMAIELATGTHIITYDDDDMYAPCYLKSFQGRFAPGVDWVWLGKMFYSEVGKIRKITQGSQNTVAFTKTAWEKVGRYAAMNVGEDRNFVSKLTTQRPGVKADIKPEETGFIYCWGNGVYHVSGMGNDKLGQMDSWQRSEHHLKSQIADGTIQAGVISLRPAIKPSPEKRIAEFLKSDAHLAQVNHGAAVKTSTTRLFHALERHEPGDARRQQAAASWDVIYEQGVHPCHYWKYERDATSIGDRRALPFLKDVLTFALEQAGDNDIVFLTNDDTVIHPALPDLLLRHITQHQACSSQRCEYKCEMPKVSESPERTASLGGTHMGRDLFAATKNWWLRYWEQLGDPILGASDWDLHLACVVRLYHGIVSNRKNLEQVMPPAEIPRGYVLHRHHAPKWMEPNNLHSAPSQVHNRLQFKHWAEKHMSSLVFHEHNVV